MTPAQWLRLAQAVGVIALGLGIYFSLSYVLDLRETNRIQADTIAQQNRASQGASEITERVGEATDDRARVDITLTDQRSAYGQAYQELKHENVTVAEYLNRRVPVELRELARQRCLARERLGNPGAGRGCLDGGAADPGRSAAPAPSD